MRCAAPLLVLASLTSSLLLGGAGCAVRSVFVKPDFATTDRLTLKRIAVVAAPVPDAPPRAAELLARIARRYVLQHKDYLALRDAALPRAEAWRERCAPDLQGVLRVTVSAIRESRKKLTLEMTAELRRCDAGQALVWRVELRDTLEKQDEDLARLAAVYRGEFGDVAQRYAAPFFVAVKTALASLPSPQLTDEETTEKITLE